jgi:hypothetical protein
MTKQEKQCKDMADVCELAHKRTIRDIKKLNKTYGFTYQVDCHDLKDCGDDGQLHKGDEEWEKNGTHYGMKAQEVFDGHYDYLCEITKI